MDGKCLNLASKKVEIDQEADVLAHRVKKDFQINSRRHSEHYYLAMDVETLPVIKVVSERIIDIDHYHD